MSGLKGLKLKQLSEAVQAGRAMPIEKIGQRLRDIREALGMTQKQLARALGISQPILSKVEDNATACTLKTIVRITQAIECEFMGAIVSAEPLEKRIRRQAEKKAKSIIQRTFANMTMEQQAPGKKSYEYQLKQLTDELAAHPNSALWEE